MQKEEADSDNGVIVRKKKSHLKDDLKVSFVYTLLNMSLIYSGISLYAAAPSPGCRTDNFQSFLGRRKRG